MAGDNHHGALRHDPAIERWYQMRENMYQRFRFTRSTAQTGILLMIIIPGALGWFASTQDLKWNWIAKRKGESLQRVPPAPTASEDGDA